MAFIALPWDFKILYGIITDTVRLPFFESFVRAPRRAYIMLFALLQAVLYYLSGFIDLDKHTLTMIFFACSLCGAYMDAVIDGITCV